MTVRDIASALAALRDLLDVELRPAPDLEALLARLGDDERLRASAQLPTSSAVPFPVRSLSFRRRNQSCVQDSTPPVNKPETSDDDS